jgi:hypothetical protein
MRNVGLCAAYIYIIILPHTRFPSGETNRKIKGSCSSALIPHQRKRPTADDLILLKREKESYRRFIPLDIDCVEIVKKRKEE